MDQGPNKTHIITVTQLTHQLKDILEHTFPDIWVEGEISNLNIPQSGHAYFTLKDEQSQIRAILFRSAQRFLKFTLQHGIQVICRGRVSVYEPRGEYQLIVDYIEPKGVGALQLAFEQLKERLEKEGLFDLQHKKPLPLLPRCIGIITSPTGAAIRDILRVIKRRHPKIRILIYPVPVQGSDAAPAIVDALRYFNENRSVDVLIAGRGGGSLEDLWAFNEETVARAIYESRIPVISAVGHETDYTIADFVSDVRAPTPSVAAEIVVKSKESLQESIRSFESRLFRSIRHALDLLRSVVREQIRILVDPRRRLEQDTLRIDELVHRMSLELRHQLRRDRTRLSGMAEALEHLNPLGILSRGYSITKKLADGRILKSGRDAKPGDMIQTILYKGSVFSRVERSEPEAMPETE